MPNFYQLCEAVDRHMDMDMDDSMPIQADEGGTKSTATYEKQDGDFWQKLADLANADPEGLAEMLGVDADKVASWYGKIKNIAQQSEKQTLNNTSKDSMLPTGVEEGYYVSKRRFDSHCRTS